MEEMNNYTCVECAFKHLGMAMVSRDYKYYASVADHTVNAHANLFLSSATVILLELEDTVYRNSGHVARFYGNIALAEMLVSASTRKELRDIRKSVLNQVIQSILDDPFVNFRTEYASITNMITPCLVPSEECVLRDNQLFSEDFIESQFAAAAGHLIGTHMETYPIMHLSVLEKVWRELIVEISEIVEEETDGEKDEKEADAGRSSGNDSA